MNLKARKTNLTIRDMCFIALFSAVISVLAQIGIPVGNVPFTLQTFGILLAGIILGAKKGTLAVLVYIMLGAVGIPVFTGFQGGIGRIFSHTGGFILSFPIMALCAGLSADLQNQFKNIWLKNAVLAGGLAAGTAINFICGMLWGKIYLELSWQSAFAGFVAPFILTSASQIILAGALGMTVKLILKKSMEI
jgi:biotin transport system substrate-specific component